MENRNWKRGAILIFMFALAASAFAITAAEKEVVCPVCGTKNTFFEYMSWGNYVYHYPSRFQLVYWPYTDSRTVYSCRKCYFSMFMWDFVNFPKDKVEGAKQMLKGVKLDAENKKYTDIPVSERLQVTGQVPQAR